MGQVAHRPIRRVHYSPPDAADTIELTTLAAMRIRGGPAEFIHPQRPAFDLMLRIESGNATHSVDLVTYDLHPGDVVWVRAGQVQQWGRIDDIEGPVVLFVPEAVDARTRDLLMASSANTRVHWPVAARDGTPVADAFQFLRVCIAASEPGSYDPTRPSALVAHALAALALLIVGLTPEGSPARRAPSPGFLAFRDEIDSSFRELHRVADYGARLGYSTRSLNRLAQANAGITAKQLIDERILIEAKRMLVHGDASVSSVAEDLGYQDASNFSAWFRHHTALTPAEFRRHARPAADSRQ